MTVPSAPPAAVVAAQTAAGDDRVADAAHLILTRDSRACTGNFFIDEDLLREAGVTDFEGYSVTPGATLIPDFFVD